MSNNLALSQIAATQSNKHVTANDQAGQLDAALTGILSVAVDDANGASLTTEQLQRHFFVDIDPDATPPDGAVSITVPAIQRGLFAVRNNTAQEVTVTVSGQSLTAPTIAAGEAVLLSNGGTDVRAASNGIPDLGNSSIRELLDIDISGIATGQQLTWNGSALVPVTEPFDVGLHLPDLTIAGALLAEIVLPRPVDFPVALPARSGSRGSRPRLRPSWGRHTKETSEKTDGLSDRRTAYQEFFQQLVDQLREKHHFTNQRVAQPDNWAHFSAGVTGIRYGVTFSSSGLRTELYIDANNANLNTAIFQALAGQREAIERELGFSLSWEALEGKRACRIATYREGSSLTEVDREILLAWTVDMLLKFRSVFRPRLRPALEAAEQAVGGAEYTQGAITFAA